MHKNGLPDHLQDHDEREQGPHDLDRPHGHRMATFIQKLRPLSRPNGGLLYFSGLRKSHIRHFLCRRVFCLDDSQSSSLLLWCIRRCHPKEKRGKRRNFRECWWRNIYRVSQTGWIISTLFSSHSLRSCQVFLGIQNKSIVINLSRCDNTFLGGNLHTSKQLFHF